MKSIRKKNLKINQDNKMLTIDNQGENTNLNQDISISKNVHSQYSQSKNDNE